MPYPRHSAMAGALIPVLAVAASLPALAQAQIRRCTTPEGGTAYTDRSCEAIGATGSRPPASPLGAARLRYRGGCSRRLQDLVFEVTSAIDARDGNRLALSYHWVGMGHRAGYAVAERLDAISQRPLVDISVLGPPRPTPASMPVPPLAPGAGTATPAATSGAAPPAAPWAGLQAPSSPPPPRRPVALRIDQVLGDGITPSATTFRLRRHMDCWWISL